MPEHRTVSVLERLLPTMFNDLYLLMRDRLVSWDNEQLHVRRTWRNGDPFVYRVVWKQGNTAAEIIRTDCEREMLATILRCRDAAMRPRRLAGV